METAINWLFGLTALMFAGIGVYLLLWKSENTAAIGLSLAASVVAVFLANLKNVKSIEAFSPINVQMRDNLDKSYALLENIEDVSVRVISSQLFALACPNNTYRENVIYPPINEQNRKLINDILARLRRMELTKPQKIEAISPLGNFVDQQLIFNFQQVVTALSVKAHGSYPNAQQFIRSANISDFDRGAKDERYLRSYMQEMVDKFALPKEYRSRVADLEETVLKLHRQIWEDFDYSEDLTSFFVRTLAVSDVNVEKVFQ